LAGGGRKIVSLKSRKVREPLSQKNKRANSMAEVVEHLHSNHVALGLITSTRERRKNELLSYRVMKFEFSDTNLKTYIKKN
jgi:hypothetical protein